MSKTSFVRHHVSKVRYYLLVFVAGYIIGFFNTFLLQQYVLNQALIYSFGYALGTAILMIIAFEIGRKVK